MALTYEQRKRKLALKIITRRHKIALARTRREDWLNDLIEMATNPTPTSPHLLATLDYDYSYLLLDPDFSSPQAAKWYNWRDLFNRHHQGRPLRQLTQAELKRLVPRTLQSACSIEGAQSKANNATALNSLIDGQLRRLNASQLSPQDKQAQTTRLQQQRECLTATTIPAPPGANNGNRVHNRNYTFFNALSDQYLFNSACQIDEDDPFWRSVDRAPNDGATIGGDFGPQRYPAGNGILSLPDVPTKRLQLCFASNDLDTYSIDRIYLIERILLHNIHQGGRAALNPWTQLAANDPKRRICNYSYTYGVLGYCHLSWNDSAFNFGS
ncbi:hypothetical protein [Marinobacter zhejiangensis]|uniref:Uncharacterized protein n=1 Tax=Marinobacter zhejiangensis TaxID=488535 RepID=A0A1I4Q1K1_9GAMM|nr:hypothetical protein [Marinobacter zhejiangensis]SFM33540.1 hypothetical protein SAMN04487963_2111 [Marinobacter zhejiangensis]